MESEKGSAYLGNNAVVNLQRNGHPADINAPN